MSSKIAHFGFFEKRETISNRFGQVYGGGENQEDRLAPKDYFCDAPKVLELFDFFQSEDYHFDHLAYKSAA